MTTMKLEDFMSPYIPLPICVINKKGRVISAGDKIGQVFLYDGIVDSDIFALTGIRASELYAAAEAGSHPLLKRNGKIFKLMCNKVSDEEDGNLAILFGDVTNLEELKDKYNNEKLCLAKIQIDNYNELISNTSAEYRITVPSEIDRIIRRWAEKIEASINKMGDDSYIASLNSSTWTM